MLCMLHMLSEVDFQINTNLFDKISPLHYLFLLILQFESIEVWQKNQSSGDERMLVKLAMKELELTHTNVRPWCKTKLTGPDGWFREVDAAAIADNCVIVVEHKNVMDKNGALQLYDLVNDIE